MDLEWMLEISSQSQCKWDKSYVLLEQQSIVVKEHYTRRKRREMLNAINHLVGKMFVICSEWHSSLKYSYCSIWQTKFFKQIFSCKEITFLNLFYITNGYESNRISYDKQLELWGEMFFHMYSFNKWCLKFSIFHHKAEFNAQILEILDLEKKFGLFLVLTKDRNDY